MEDSKNKPVVSVRANNVRLEIKPRCRWRLIAVAVMAATVFTARATELPPLPEPTTEQLQRGKELLDKIAYVVKHVPLSDEVAVMKIFGFTDLNSRNYATHRDVGPRGKEGDFPLPDELILTDFTYIEVQPWINSTNHQIKARLSASFLIDKTCISLVDVTQIFSGISKNKRLSPTIYAHPVDRRKRVTNVDNLTFTGLQSHADQPSLINFRFEHQTCANSVSFAYLTN